MLQEGRIFASTETSLNADEYVNVLKDLLLPFVLCVIDDSFVFMKDKAAVHQAKDVKDWFEHTDIPVLE